LHARKQVFTILQGFGILENGDMGAWEQVQNHFPGLLRWSGNKCQEIVRETLRFEEGEAMAAEMRWEWDGELGIVGYRSS